MPTLSHLAMGQLSSHRTPTPVTLTAQTRAPLLVTPGSKSARVRAALHLAVCPEQVMRNSCQQGTICLGTSATEDSGRILCVAIKL